MITAQVNLEVPSTPLGPSRPYQFADHLVLQMSWHVIHQHSVIPLPQHFRDRASVLWTCVLAKSGFY